MPPASPQDSSRRHAENCTDIVNGRVQIVAKLIDFCKHIGIPATFSLLLLLGLWQIAQTLLKSHTEFLEVMKENSREQTRSLERVVAFQENHAKEIHRLIELQNHQLELQNKILMEMKK